MAELGQHVRVGITCGDLNGIGLEVIIKTFLDHRTFTECTPIIYASHKAVSFYRKVMNATEFNYNTIKTANLAIPHKVNVCGIWEEDVKIEPGISTDDSAKYAFRSFESAVNDLQSGLIDVLVTSPIDKYTVMKTGQANFTGHTEYLSEKFSVKNYLMFLLSGNLRVGVVTGHVPLQQVSASLSIEKIVSKAKVMNESLKKDFGITRPRIAILGLNPHAGDNGLIGSEEKEIIIPAVKKLTEENIFAFGPYSADGFFGSASFTKFDGILAMYHDQGLVPFKSLAFDSGVNFTAGIPIIRTSPDHGPAFDIAGKNMANESSFREAFFVAQDIFLKREEYKVLSKNPLPLGFSKMSGDQ